MEFIKRFTFTKTHLYRSNLIKFGLHRCSERMTERLCLSFNAHLTDQMQSFKQINKSINWLPLFKKYDQAGALSLINLKCV